MFRSPQYEPLLQGESDAPVQKGYDAPESDGVQKVLSYSIRISTFIISICCIIDAVALAYALGPGIRTALPAAVPTQTLSTYVNFDQLYETKLYTTRHEPLYNRPRNYFQVSSAEPTTTFAYWSSLELDIQGYVKQEDYRLLVTPEVSTIMQFRIFDYGMEKCLFKFNIPQGNTSTSNFTISADGSSFDIWRLSADQPLTGQLSWNTKPKRMELVTTIDAYKSMAANLSTFPCLTGSFHTFEIACSNRPCHLDGNWRINPPIYILQFQTLGL